MQNVFNLEIDVAHRRGEWERAVAAAAQHAQVPSQHQRPSWSLVAPLARAYRRALATLRVPVTSWNPAGVQCAETREGGHAPAT